MSDPPARPVLAASIAVFRDGRVLVARRARAPALGLWSLPGGRIEPGERMAEGALRELAEEVGVTAEIVGFVDHVEHIEHDPAGLLRAHAVIAAFAGRWIAGEPTPSAEISDIRWVDPLAPGDLAMTRGLEAVLARAARLVAGAAA
ncbi:NUDIX hydrolase [Rhabdaerophilum calidifontis]|uniref:NUDIX hydrolase n=1 Tax=Rhabdaerophilum calidifontis TaxID=2604328 RepID=UPI00123B3FAE|nr:NUDIX hydrolase [Rhabdaerophilum calidifontis]